ncbi:MAG: MATE family efflux transporter [Clostridia bacterium]|nr:MATE family efflux transporter [Clostridia bacterium]
MNGVNVNNNEFLGKDPLGRLLFRLALPTITAQIINLLYNVVDRVYIGHMDEIGELALTGVGVCMPLIMIISAFAALISSGGAPRASIFMGQGDYESAERTMGACFTLQCIISAVLTAVMLVFHRPMLLAFGASENTIGYATEYMSIYSIGTIFVQLTLGMNAYITAQGYAKMSMLTVVIGAIANIILDPIFIFLFDMGVSGAALATIISQAISCAWVIFFLHSKNSILRLKKSSIRLDLKLVLPCIALGLAPFIMQASESVISICFNSSLYNYGGDIAVGAMTVLTSVMQFAMLPLQGLASGAQPIISYNYGAKNKERVKGIFRILLTSSLVYSLTLWALIMIFPRAFAAIFTSNVAYLDYTESALRIYCAVIGIFGIQVACQMTFVSLGKALSSMAVAIMRKFVLLLPLIYIVPLFFEGEMRTTGVYLAEPIADTLAVTFTAVLFAIQFKKALREIEN